MIPVNEQAFKVGARLRGRVGELEPGSPPPVCGQPEAHFVTRLMSFMTSRTCAPGRLPI